MIRSHAYRTRSLTLLLTLLTLATAPWSSQVVLGQEDTAPQAPAEDASPAAGTWPHNLPSAQIPSEDDAFRPGALAQVNQSFEKLVGLMEATLFYRILGTPQRYVAKDHVVYFVRERDTTDEFQILPASAAVKPDKLPDSLNTQQLLGLRERGLVVLSPDATRSYRRGELGNKLVDYVTYVVDNQTKYVQVIDDSDAVTYRRVTKMRGKLEEDPELWLSPAMVAEMAAQGILKTDSTNGAATPYLFTESVHGAPLVVLWLAGGAIVFTIYFGFVNFWGFYHALQVVRGTYDDPDEPGEVTHFQALASALSATVGLGNISGVTIAMASGGPGAFFWMVMCGFLGMSSKFVECSLGQMYRKVKPDGTILGGPMQYLTHAFEQFDMKPVGIVFSLVFAVMCVMASFGGGNMFQSNQATQQVLGMAQELRGELQESSDLNREIKAAAEAENIDLLSQLQARRTELNREMDQFARMFKIGFGVVMAVAVSLVIIGGIKRIGAAASKIVPSMCLIYVLACLWIIGTHITEVPAMILLIISEAFNPEAMGGGLLGVLIIGVQRAAFSNEAGVGSAAIAHSAAKTDEPIREGLVALLEPFIDTIVVCSLTALVILITGAWNNQDWIVTQNLEGVQLTSRAFGDKIEFFPYLLTVAVVLFAFSTVISWSYYGERCWERLFGARSTIVYKVLFVAGVFFGAIFELGPVTAFADIALLAMAFPNILGALLLAPVVKRELHAYWAKYKSGEFEEARQ
ncbi:MAG: alanine/glycine:cation symporter family protein [Pirellulaceae bacterium]